MMTGMEPILVDRIEAARLVSVSPRTWDRMVQAGEMPAPRLIRGMKRWKVEEIRARVDGADDPACHEIEIGLL